MRLPVSFFVPMAVTALIAAAALCATAAAVPAADSPPPPAAQTMPSAISATAALSGMPGAATTHAAGPAAADSARGDPAFTWPLSPRPTVVRRFERPRDQYSPGHRGVDLLAAVGQPVLSAGQGVVAFSGVIAGRGVITIRHPGGLRTSYEPVDTRLTSGTLVHRGARIGVISGTAGHCAPLTCLHWGAISGSTYVDPLSLLGLGHPILLPLG
jgi:murein DD-endopeptidase MepM/ murein hydrolase activator NlpD